MRSRNLKKSQEVVSIVDSNGLLDVSGKWELDKERSESMFDHMKAMGCEEIAALASEKLNITLNIVQQDGAITIWQETQLGLTKRMIFLNQETDEEAMEEVRKVTVSANSTEMSVETKFKRGKVVDKRQILKETDGSLVLVTALVLTLKGKAGSIKTTRYFNHVGEPDEEVVIAHKEAVAAGKLAPAVTLSASTVRHSRARAARDIHGMEEDGKPPLAPSPVSTQM